MPLTPNDILEREFRVRLKGYDVEEVDIFLEEVATAFAAAVKEVNTLRDQVVGCEARIAELKSGEADLRQALLSAHRLAEGLKSQASREAEVIVERARVEATRIVDDAHREAARLEERLRDLGRMRREVVSKIRASLEGYLRMLDEDLKDAPEVPPSLNFHEQVSRLESAGEEDKAEIESALRVASEFFSPSAPEKREDSPAGAFEEEGEEGSSSQGPVLDLLGDSEESK